MTVSSLLNKISKTITVNLVVILTFNPGTPRTHPYYKWDYQDSWYQHNKTKYLV